MEYYSAIKKNKIMPFAATWMELETLILSQSERERQIPYDITYIWNLIYGTNEPFHRKETHGLGDRLVVAKGEGEGMEWIGELGVSCLWNGLAMRSCCVALGTMSSHL